VQRRLAAILVADVVGYTRLMEADEEGTLARFKALRRDLIEPKIAEHGGRVFKAMGDAILVEFPSSVAAVQNAIELQRALSARNADAPEDRRVTMRIGINVGDVIVEENDLYGEGVNVAGRLESLAEPGGICLSGDVHRQIRGKVEAAFEDLGERAMKNVAEPIRVFGWRADGAPTGRPARAAPPVAHQEIRFCTTEDGVRIAYATTGSGPALVKAANWMNHLEFDWESPIWRHWIEALGSGFTLVRYDERGNGLSDWDVGDLSFELMVRDLETVVDAIGLERFALLGISQGCPISVAYAVRHPGRVSHLVLYGGYVCGWRARGNPAEIARREALSTLIEHGWGQDTSAFHQIFTSLFMPGGTPQQMAWFNDLQRASTSPRNARRLHEAMAAIDVRGLLGQVRTPTLVLHCRNDSVAPFDQGRQFAAGIPGARFVPLESANHLILPEEPAWARFMAEVKAFLRGEG